MHSVASQQVVAVFWDYENCRPPANVSGHTIAQKVRSIAQIFGRIAMFKAYLDISLEYNSSNSKVGLLHSELQSSGVSLTHCPHNGKKEVADKMMLVDMIAFAIDQAAPATIVVISGDGDFSYGVSTLRMRNYNVIVIAPTFHAHSNLLAQTTDIIRWQSIFSEQLSSDHQSPNSLQQTSATASRSNYSIPTSASTTLPQRDGVSYPFSRFSADREPFTTPSIDIHSNVYSPSVSLPQLHTMQNYSSDDQSRHYGLMNPPYTPTSKGVVRNTFQPPTAQATTDIPPFSAMQQTPQLISKGLATDINIIKYPKEANPVPQTNLIQEVPRDVANSRPSSNMNGLSLASNSRSSLNDLGHESSNSALSGVIDDGNRLDELFFLEDVESRNTKLAKCNTTYVQGSTGGSSNDDRVDMPSLETIDLPQGSACSSSSPLPPISTNIEASTNGPNHTNDEILLSPGEHISNPPIEARLNNIMSSISSLTDEAFKPLIQILKNAQAEGKPKLQWSQLGSLMRNGQSLYRLAGVDNFKGYLREAQKAGIISVEGTDRSKDPNLSWIKLNVEASRIQEPNSPKTNSANSHSNIAPDIDVIFVPLITAIKEIRDVATGRALRSRVNETMLNKFPNVFREAKVSGYPGYLTKAAEANIVTLGSGAGGRDWVKLLIEDD